MPRCSRCKSKKLPKYEVRKMVGSNFDEVVFWEHDVDDARRLVGLLNKIANDKYHHIDKPLYYVETRSRASS